MTWSVALARGVGRIVATALVSYALAWTLAELAAGSPAERAAAAAGVAPGPDAPAAVRAQVLARTAELHHLDGSAAARIGRATAALLVLELGRSWRDRRPVASLIRERVAVTARIVAIASLLALALGATAGAALARLRGAAAAAGGVVLALATAAPPAWLAFAVLDAGAGRELVAAMVLAVAPAATVAVQVRAALAGFLTAPVAVALRARGMSEARLAAHGLRNVAPSLAPLLTSVGAYALGACVVVERAFVLPGLGSLGLDAASRGDAPVLAGLAALAGGAVATLSVVADLGARLADPREELA